jgi:hypothetical protein
MVPPAHSPHGPRGAHGPRSWDDQNFKRIVSAHLLRQVYEQIRREAG